MLVSPSLNKSVLVRLGSVLLTTASMTLTMFTTGLTSGFTTGGLAACDVGPAVSPAIKGRVYGVASRGELLSAANVGVAE